METPSRLSSVDEFEERFVRPRDGRTLIVGSKVYDGRTDRRKAYDDAFGVDMLEGVGVDLVWNMERLLPAGTGLFWHVECWSVLEHAKRPWKVAHAIEQAMYPGATIYLTVPLIWRVHGYPHDYWRFTRSGVAELFPNIDWEVLANVSHMAKYNDSIPSMVDEEGYPFLARTEVCGFGMRK